MNYHIIVIASSPKANTEIQLGIIGKSEIRARKSVYPKPKGVTRTPRRRSFHWHVFVAGDASARLHNGNAYTMA